MKRHLIVPWELPPGAHTAIKVVAAIAATTGSWITWGPGAGIAAGAGLLFLDRLAHEISEATINRGAIWEEFDRIMQAPSPPTERRHRRHRSN